MKGWKIFVVAIVLYFVSIFGGFIQDDLKVVVSDPQMGSVKALFASFTRSYYYMDGGNAGLYRPMTSFSLYLNALVTGKEAWGFRLLNILLYGVVCLLIFEVLKKICNEKTAFGIALIFTVLPVHTEVVNNVVGRSEMLSLGFLLIAILMQMKKRWEFSSLIFFLALLSKETAIVGLPILVFLMISEKEKKDTKVGAILFYVLVTISYLILRTMVLGDKGMVNNATIVENPLKFVGTTQRVMNAFALLPFGVGKTIFPLRLSYDYSFNQLEILTSWLDWRVLLGVGMVFLSLASLFSGLRKNKLWILGQAFFWGPLVITGNFIYPVGTIFGERLWFWPSLGLILILSTLFNPTVLTNLKNRTLFCLRKIRSCFQPKILGVPRNQAFRLCAIFFESAKYFGFVLIIIFSARTFVRNLDWLSEERLFIHDAAYVKGSVMAQSNAAAMYLIKKDFVKGKELMEKADKIYPRYPELMNNWGMYYLWLGDTKTAKEKFENCLKEKPGYYLCKVNLDLVK